MKVYVIKSTIVATVEANNKAEALKKLSDGKCKYIVNDPEIIGKFKKENRNEAGEEEREEKI